MQKNGYFFVRCSSDGDDQNWACSRPGQVSFLVMRPAVSGLNRIVRVGVCTVEFKSFRILRSDHESCREDQQAGSTPSGANAG